MVVRLDAIDDEEMRELVIDAWRMVVPKRVAAEHLGEDPRSTSEHGSLERWPRRGPGRGDAERPLFFDVDIIVAPSWH